MLIGSFAQKAFSRCPPVLQKSFWTYERDIGKNRKSGIVLWSNSIKPTWNIMFLFFVSTKRMHIDNFVQNAFSRCPPVLQKSFRTYERDFGKNRKSGIVLWSNSIKWTWNKCFFSSFPQKGCILIVSHRRLSVGAPQYSRNNFGPIKEILKKNRKSGVVLWSNSIKPTWNIMFLFFVSTKRKHIDNFVQNAFNRCPPVLQKSFRTYERDIGKNRKSGIVLWSKSIKSTWNKCFYSTFPQKGCILIVSLRRLSIGAPSTPETILDL